MEMTRSESKYFNNASKMQEALFELLETKDFNTISIKEVCSLSKVSRTTFYLHYETLYDLLEECIETSDKTFISYFNENPESIIKKVETCPQEELRFCTREYLEPYLRYIFEHKRLFQAYFLHPEVMHSLDRYHALYINILSPILNRFNVKEEDKQYILTFFINGIMAIIC